MSFLFAPSHLPAVRSTRPELEEEEEEDVNPESLPRSGGVRASSHLEERAADSARRTEGSPAPRRADAASDWPGRLKELAEQQRTRSAPAAPDERPRRADAEHEPDAEPDQDEDETPGGVHDEAPEHGGHDATSSWYHPPESGSYDPDPGFHLPPKDIGPASPDTGFYQHLPEIKGEETPATGAGRTPSSFLDWRGRQSNAGRGQPQEDQRGVRPDAPAGSGPASGRTGAFPNSRLFEVRPHPALAGMTGAGGGTTPRMLGGQAAAGSRFYDASQSPAGPRKGIPPSFSAPAENSAKEERQPLGQSPSQAQQGATTKQAAPITTLAQTSSPPAETSKENQPTFKVDPADESRMDFKLEDPVAQREYPTDHTFGDRVRPILQEELDKSPTARNLLERIIGKSGKPVIIKLTTEPEAYPQLARDGTLTVYINPAKVRIGTLPHEITHLLQTLALQRALKNAPRDKDGKTTPEGISKTARDLLNGLLPISLEEERNGKLSNPQNYMENEAMRAANIAKAEISAARVKERLDAMNETERASYQNDHAKLAALFWAEQLPHEDTGHTGSDKLVFPIDTKYGECRFEHVLKTLGITKQELMEACPYKKKLDEAAQERARKAQATGKAGGQ